MDVDEGSMETTSQLFDPSPLLDWLPDETLFSLASRNHYLWGCQDWETCMVLFGCDRSGTQHDLPNHLWEFERRTLGRLGKADTIACNRTLLRYYRKFLSREEEQDVIVSLCGESEAHLKLHLGLLTSRFRANHPLKACTACMAKDVDQFGWAYWHLVHQFPGVWICPKHQSPLMESALKTTGIERFHWLLPNLESLRPWSEDELKSFDENHAVLSSLARTTQELIEGPVRIDTARLHAVYRSELALRGWLSNAKRLRLMQIATSFMAHSSKLRFLPALSAFPQTIDQSLVQVGKLLRPEHSGVHPIRHVVLIDWLFGDAASFLTRYQALDTMPAGPGTGLSLIRRKKLKILVKSSGARW